MAARSFIAVEPITPLPDSPGWFRDALAVPFTDETVEVGGAPVHYLAWGEPGQRGLIFVHGGGAHAHWWTHVAARFADDFRVVALDLSGHGDSSHRDTYDFEQWCAEVIAVAEDSGIDGLPVVVGHSMGGFVTIATAALHPERVSGVIICDSPVTEPDPEVASAHLKQEFGRTRTYATVDEAVARFRTVPAQARYLPYVMDHVARRSLRPTDGGYRWKFDPNVFVQFFGSSIRGVALPYLRRLVCRFALLRSENGIVTTDISDFMSEQLGRVAPVVEIPEAGHHPMLDEPLILLTALRSLLADWEHSEPHRRR